MSLVTPDPPARTGAAPERYAVELSGRIAWLLDVLVVAAAATVTNAVVAYRFGSAAAGIFGSLPVLASGVGIAALGAYASGLGDRSIMLSTRATWARAAVVGIAAAVGAVLASYFAHYALGGRIGPVVFGVSTLLGLGGWRTLYARWLARCSPVPIVVVGNVENCRQLATLLAEVPRVPYRIDGLVTDDEVASEMFAVLGRIVDLPAICKARRTGLVVLATDVEPTPVWVETLNQLRTLGVRCRSAGSLTMSIARKVPLDLVGTRWLVESLEVASTRGRHRGKRVVDIVLALMGLGLLALLLPALWVAVKLDSPGPIFFSQERVGLGGVPFRIYKIRTMRCAPPGERWAAADDRRITAIGRFLRRTRIDEFPQFWNVLRGDMSIVGPRPEQPGISATLEGSIPLFGLRHLVRPGITGWAQIQAGYAASVEASATKVAYDVYYARNYSLLLDLDIMLRTAFVMVLGHGAR